MAKFCVYKWKQHLTCMKQWEYNDNIKMIIIIKYYYMLYLVKSYLHRKNQAPGDAWPLAESDNTISWSCISFLDNLNYSIVWSLFQARPEKGGIACVYFESKYYQKGWFQDLCARLQEACIPYLDWTGAGTGKTLNLITWESIYIQLDMFLWFLRG